MVSSVHQISLLINLLALLVTQSARLVTIQPPIAPHAIPLISSTTLLALQIALFKQYLAMEIQQTGYAILVVKIVSNVLTQLIVLHVSMIS